LKLQQKIEVPIAVFGTEIVGLSGNSGKRASAEPYAQSTKAGRILLSHHEDLT
jgi:hypothetical protein